MTKARLDALIAGLIIFGALGAFAVVAWLARGGTGEGALAAVVGLATMLLNLAASIVRNRFPGPEIDVVPAGFEANACTCGNEKEATHDR
jgi:hypothetical protein